MKLSASKIELASHCLYPFVCETNEVESTSEAARVGRLFHATMEDLVNGWHACKIDADIEHLRARDVYDLLLARHDGGQSLVGTEVAYEYHSSQTDDFLDILRIDCKSRDYPWRTGCIYGTADVVFEDVVIDYKTGRQENTRPAKDNLQLRFLAMCAGVNRGELWFVSPSGVVIDEAEYTDAQFVELRQMLADFWKLAPMCAPEPGPHCSELYCPMISECPAIETALAVAPSTAVSLTPQTAEEWLGKLFAFDRAAEKLRSALEQWADQNGAIPCGDRVWCAQESCHRSVEIPCTVKYTEKAIIEKLGPRGLEFLEAMGEKVVEKRFRQYRKVKP